MRGTGMTDRRAVPVLRCVIAQLAVMSGKDVSGLCGGQSSLMRDPASDRMRNSADAMHPSTNRAVVMVTA